MNMPDIRWNTISANMREMMVAFATAPISDNFYLAGWTALALQLGHRRSADLDFFSQTKDIPTLIGPLLASLAQFEPQLADSFWGNLVFLVRGVRIGFYGYGYDLLQPLIKSEGTGLASVMDIGLMKLEAVLGRAGRKDFIDLYEICKHHSLRELLDLAPRKYPGVRDFETQVVKRLVYFEQAEKDAHFPMLVPVDWDVVKGFFQEQAEEIGKQWIG